MKKVLFVAFILVSFFAKSQNWTNINGRWGYEWLRTSKALFIPSGNGAPSGTASLQGAGYKLQSAFYSDTTNKKVYVFQPKDSTWLDITAVAGVIGPTMGGTGLTTVTTGDLLYGSATNTWAKLPGVATGNALISGGVGTAFSWGKIGLTTHVSGILPVANGGTGTATPGLVQGTNVTITGTWPNQTINATGGGTDTNALKSSFLPLFPNGNKTINQTGNNIFFTGGGELKSDSFKLSTLTAPPVVTGLVALGHSIMYGQGASTNDSTLKYRNSHYYNLTLSDLSLSASGIWRAASNFYLNINPGHSNFTTVMAGLNDVRRNGWAAATHAKLINGYNAIFANQYLATWVPAGNAAVDKSGGTWSVGYTSSTVGGKSVGQGIFSTTLNDYAEWTFSGNNVVVGLMGADGVGGSNYEYAMFEIYVDGVLKKSGNETGQWDGVSDGVNDNKRGTYPVIITGLSSGSHTVQVKQKEAGKYFVVDYFGTLVAPSAGKPLMIYHDPYLTSAGYSTSPSNASNSILDSLNNLIDSLASVYTSWGYTVYVAQTNSYYNPNTDAGGDGIHPVDVGYWHMFEAGRAAFATTLIPASPGTIYYTNNGKFYGGLTDGTVKSFAYDGDTSSYIRNQTSNTQTGGFKINGTGTVGTIVAPTATLGNTTIASGTGALLTFNPIASQTMISAGGSITGSVITADHEISATNGLLWVQRNLSTASGAYSAMALAVKGNGNGTGGAQFGFRNDGAAREYIMGYDVRDQRFKITWGNQDQFSGRMFFSLDSLTGYMHIARPQDGNSSDSMLVWRSSDSSVRKVAAPTSGGTQPIDAQYTDANNSGTSATDLYSKTIAANQCTLNGQSIHFEAAGVNNDATATVNLEALFAGNGIAGTGAVTITGTGVWSMYGTIIRATSSTARVYTVVTIDNCTQKVFSTTANLTGIDWTTTNILKIRATAGGGGGGSDDITAQMWKVEFHQ